MFIPRVLLNLHLSQNLCQSNAKFLPQEEALCLRHDDEDVGNRIAQLQKSLEQIHNRLEEKVHVLASVIMKKDYLCMYALAYAQVSVADLGI